MIQKRINHGGGVVMVVKEQKRANKETLYVINNEESPEQVKSEYIQFAEHITNMGDIHGNLTLNMD